MKVQQNSVKYGVNVTSHIKNHHVVGDGVGQLGGRRKIKTNKQVRYAFQGPSLFSSPRFKQLELTKA